MVANPYAGTEKLEKKGKLNLKGCRSAHVGMNFRIIFVICEECRREPECEYCFCDGLPDQAVPFDQPSISGLRENNDLIVPELIAVRLISHNVSPFLPAIHSS